MFDFKNIHIGELIYKKVKELQIETSRLCRFLDVQEKDLRNIYTSPSLDSQIILRFSKILKYDFFRIYSQHLILYKPPTGSSSIQNEDRKSALPEFKKNIYTHEIIDFIVECIENKTKTMSQVITEYGIPKTTLYKWIIKYGKSEK